MAIDKITKYNFPPTKLPVRVPAEKVNEIIDLLNTITAGGSDLTTLVVDATSIAVTIDGATTDHTGSQLVYIDADVDVDNLTNDFNAIDVNIDTTVAMAANEDIKGMRITIDGLAANLDGSGLCGIEMDLTAVSTDRADVYGLYIDIDSVRDTADTDNGVLVYFTGTMSAGSSTGFGVSTAGQTHTAGNFYGTNIIATNAITAGSCIAHGVVIDSTGFSNPKYGLLISKDLTNSTAVGALSQTNEAISIGQLSATSALASGASTVSNNTVYVNRYNSTSVASADVYAGNEVALTYTAYTSAAGTATNSTTSLLIDYNIAEVDGTLTNSAFNVVSIDFDGTGTPVMGAGNYNLLLIDGDTAASPAYAATSIVSGIRVDMTGMTVTDTNLFLNGILSQIPNVGTSGMRAIYASNAAGTVTAAMVDGTDALIVKGRVRDDVAVGTHSYAYMNVKTLLYKVGVQGVAGMDYNFSDDADSDEESHQLGGGAIIPANSQILGIVVHCADGLNDAGTATVDVGNAAGGGQYITDSAGADDTDEIIGLDAYADTVTALSAAASSVYFAVNPSVNWDTLTNGTWWIYITYIDNSAVA